MELTMDRLQPRCIDMRVNLRRCDVGVAQEFLHLSEICTAGKQVRCKTVTQGVGTYVRRSTRSLGILLDELPDCLTP